MLNIKLISRFYFQVLNILLNNKNFNKKVLFINIHLQLLDLFLLERSKFSF